MVVGALIFVLGIDLVKEALWDTRHRVNRSVSIFLISSFLDKIEPTIWGTGGNMSLLLALWSA